MENPESHSHGPSKGGSSYGEKEAVLVSSIICPVTGFSQREKAALKRSWKRIFGKDPQNQELFGINFTSWLIDSIPNAHQKFTRLIHVPRHALSSNPRFHEIALTFAKSFDDVLGSLNQAEYLHFKCRNIVVAHLYRPGSDSIGLEYFRPLRDRFHAFLREYYATTEEDREEMELWTRLMAVFVRVMEEEVDERDRRSSAPNTDTPSDMVTVDRRQGRKSARRCLIL